MRPGVPLSLDHGAQIDAALSALSTGHGERALSDPLFSNLYLFRHVHDYRYVPASFACITGRSASSILAPIRVASSDANRHVVQTLTTTGPEGFASDVLLP